VAAGSTARDGMDLDIYAIPRGQASDPACGAPSLETKRDIEVTSTVSKI
jgi:hypothetical protein